MARQTFPLKRRFEAIIDGHVAPLAARAGFADVTRARRQDGCQVIARIFERSASPVRQQIDVQRDKYNTRNRYRFTINFLLLAEEDDPRLRFRPGQPRDLAIPALMARPGSMVHGNDHWWTLTNPGAWSRLLGRSHAWEQRADRRVVEGVQRVLERLFASADRLTTIDAIAAAIAAPWDDLANMTHVPVLPRNS